MASIRLTLYFKAGGFAIPSIFLDIRKLYPIITKLSLIFFTFSSKYFTSHK